jgi:DNA-binding PadR family transcriptional regulator
MPKKALDTMTESMFYTLLALLWGPKCGIEIAAFTDKLTRGRGQLGPGTLYTILAKFLESGYLREVAVEGRKRTYALTEAGRQAYAGELGRLRQCLRDAEAAVAFSLTEGGGAHEGADAALPPAPLPAL